MKQTIARIKKHKLHFIFKNRRKKKSSAERYSTKQISLGTLINWIIIHYEDFSFLLRGESAPFEVTVPFTPFSKKKKESVLPSFMKKHKYLYT